jgi:amidase
MSSDLTDLAFAGATEQARAIRAGEVSARELIDATLARIEAIDPVINAYRVVLADDARRAADDADAALRSGDDRPLLGVPVAIKDDTDVAGEVTAWGSDAHGPSKTLDSDVVARLRAAGAIVIGKTNVPELTLWPWTSSATWGVTKNPWDLTRTPGGSSGGAAAALATGLCGLAQGSDGGGSIRYPAALTGLFGLKTQRGRISLGPDHHDAWNGLTVYGPLTRTVADAALFLDVTATVTPAGTPPGGYREQLTQPLERLRIAVSCAPPPGTRATLHDEQRRAVERTAAVLRDLGHTVFDHEIDYGPKVARNVAIRYLRGMRHDTTTLAHPKRLARLTKQLRATAALIPARTLAHARRDEAAIATRINTVFERADVVLTPATVGPPPPLADVVDRGLVTSLNQAFEAAYLGPWNAIGQPAATVPAGLDSHGLPVAVQLAGRVDDESTLLRLAAELERARPWAMLRPPLLTERDL